MKYNWQQADWPDVQYSAEEAEDYRYPRNFRSLNARKYVSLNKTSKPTATRDLQDLCEKDILTKIGGGRSTSYFLKFMETSI